MQDEKPQAETSAAAKLKELEDITVNLSEEPAITQNILDTGRRRLAAVLALIRVVENEPLLIFMRRTEKVHTHKGQISFPGGGYKPEDGSLENTARRETAEELGIAPDAYRILGPLPPIDTVVSNFMIHPFLGLLHSSEPLDYVPDDFEVAEILEIPLRPLMQPQALQIEQWIVQGRSRRVRFYNYRSTVIWGATAHILQEFFTQLQNGQWPEIQAMLK